MKRTIFAGLAIFLLSLAVHAQDKSLPDYGDISDLKGMSAIYVNADSTEARKSILF